MGGSGAGCGVDRDDPRDGGISKEIVMAKKKQAPKKARGKAVVAKRTPKRRTAAPVLSARAAVRPVKMRITSSADEPVSVTVEPAVAVAAPSHEAIARRAFENWLMHLRLANDPVANWLEAESQLCDELARG